MKKAVLILAVLLLIGGSLFLFGAEELVQTVTLGSIPEGPVPDASADGADLLLSFGYNGLTLPANEDGTVLLPVIPEAGVTVTSEKGVTLTKTVTSETYTEGTLRSVAVTVQKGSRSRTLTLRETGMAVAELELELRGVTEGSDPIRDKEREGTLHLFSIDENGGLRYETGSVSAKLRGASSRGYKKKSYTLINLDASGEPTARSLMGLPADTRFGLNSMYEDDVKLRDILSLNVWEAMQPAGTPCIRMRYCELYIDGVYWGLYGFQQVVSANALGLTTEDGLTKILSDYEPSILKKRKTWAAKVVQPLTDGDVAYRLLDALALLSGRDPAALDRFDTESLFRYALYLQFICGTDSSFKNIVGAYHTGTGRFSLAAYDTDQSFGLMWDNACPPLYMGVHPELSKTNFLKGDDSPWAALLSDELGTKQAVTALWSTLRESALAEGNLLADARALFTLVTESGAREREHTRWPRGNYCAELTQIETFITERLAYCDAFFATAAESGK